MRATGAWAVIGVAVAACAALAQALPGLGPGVCGTSEISSAALEREGDVAAVRRLADVPGFLARRQAAAPHVLDDLMRLEAWADMDVRAPNVTDRATLQLLARLACLAYYEDIPHEVPGAPAWHTSSRYGWEGEGLHAQIFATAENRTVVVALKGTSASFLPGGSTGQRDKDNDNLLFSCCCARVSSSWTPVCGCYRDGQQCDVACVGRAMIDQSLYYPAATDMYNHIAYLYPNSQVWVTGHSLGGVLAGFLGTTFGVPAVAFEAPGDRLAATRLHLPLPPGDDEALALTPVTHVYHTADSLATGQCVGPTSICSRTGFAMETKCHLGTSVVYDTVRYLHWAVGVLPHRITYVLDELLAEDWDDRVRRAGSVPPAPLGAVPAPQRETSCEGASCVLTPDCRQWTWV